jgi:putative hemolysin
MLETEAKRESQAEGLQRSVTLVPASGLVAKFLPLEEISDLYGRVRQSSRGSWFENLLEEMQVTFSADERDLSRIPTTGAALAVSNHPFGLLDGAVLGALLSQVRSDVKIMTNFLLSGVPELRDHCIFVDPFSETGSIERNRGALKQALLWLKRGHLLGVFPAGEVSHLQLPWGEITDPAWNPMIARLARITQATVLPVFFHGRNSIAFQTLGLMHPPLRTAWLMNEFLKQTGKTVQVRIGSAVSSSTLDGMPSDEDAIQYFRRRTYLLAERARSAPVFPRLANLPLPRKSQQPIAAATPKEQLIAEVEGLSNEQCLAGTRDMSVYVAQARQIPCLMQELGRLREITFRDVGEGTGRSRDLDQFDDYYLHVFLWDNTRQQVVGAYRMGNCPSILASHGPGGLYTSTLFRYDPQFFEKLGPAVELGRSFVLPEYQRQFAPLLLLWKGIASYISERPETPVLFGAVSISSRYSSASRELMVRYFESRQREEMSKFVRPRRPFRSFRLRPWDLAAIGRSLHDLEDLGDSVSDLESDAKGIPILFRQYAKLGGTMLAFNVDRNFSNSLDGLVFVDLRRTPMLALERYMGKEGSHRFRKYHGLLDPRQPEPEIVGAN